jgi:hypothetical protein
MTATHWRDVHEQNMSIVQYLNGSPWFSSVIGRHVIVIPPPQFLKFLVRAIEEAKQLTLTHRTAHTPHRL